MRDRIAAAAGVKHLNETGFRSGGQTQGLPKLSTPWLTFSRTSARRGCLPGGLRRCLVHDPGQPSCTIRGVRHALGHAHHLRELPALADSAGEDWVRRLQELLKWAQGEVRSARERGMLLPRSLAERIGRCYDLLVGEALKYHEARPPLRPPRKGQRGNSRQPLPPARG